METPEFLTYRGRKFRVQKEVEALPKITGDTPPSEQFELAFRGSGSLVVNCEFCGRVHFADSVYAGDWESEELENLRKDATENPDQYIGWEYDSVTWGYLNGQQYVHGCPCNEARRYEEFIWSHRFGIAEYLKLRSEIEQLEADQNKKTAEKVCNVVK